MIQRNGNNSGLLPRKASDMSHNNRNVLGNVLLDGFVRLLCPDETACHTPRLHGDIENTRAGIAMLWPRDTTTVS